MISPSDRPKSPSAAELIGAFVALGAVALVQVIAMRRLELFYHPLWLDETFTFRIANDPSFSHMLAAVRGGVDTNPPTLYLMLWPLARLFGSLDNTGLRIFVFLWMLAGMTGLYAICRRFFTRGPSIVAVLAVWAHPLIIDHAFEARYYSPWLALTVWFCYLQMIADDDEPTPRRIARYVLGILATSIHYFGAISMTMIAATDLLLYRRIKRIIPAILGCIAIAACIPFLHGQRAGLSIPTWIQPIGPSDIRDDIVAIFGAPPFIVVLLVMWICTLLSGPKTPGNPPSRNFRELLPLSSLLLFPVVIVVFSKIVQPALVLRFLILTIAPLAPLMAFLIERASRRAAIGAAIGLVAMGAGTVIGKSHATRGLDYEFNAAITAIDQRVPPDGLIVFKRRREMLPILHMRPDLAPRSAQLDFDDSVLPNVTRMSQYERDMGRKQQLVYPDLRMTTIAELTRLGRFYVVAPLDEYEELKLELPGFIVADPESVLHSVSLAPVNRGEAR